MTAVLATPPFIEFMDANGNPLAGGLIYTYAAGTLTPKATFTDPSETVPMSNPIVLDSAGRAVWFINGAYKYIVKDALGNTIRTVDQVTSFSTLADAALAFFQSFSGNGIQTVFTLSSSLGTDSKNLMVFLDKGLETQIANGNFASDTIWTKGSGWTIAAGVATATGAISTAISQNAVQTLVPGKAYAVTYDITASAGSLTPSIGGQNGTARTVTGTYREVIVAGSTQVVAFTGAGFTGTLDNVTVTPADPAGFDILNPAVYTVNGTALTFATPPAVGTNNVYVFAPSLLLGAASAAAALAQGYATAAAASATAAAASAVLAGLNVKWKPAVACATVGNITLSGEQTIDGVLTSSARVLVKNQTNQTENGVYVSAAGAWTRATDADTWTEIMSQAVAVTGGTVNIRTSWANTNEAGGTIGVDNITWTQLFFYPPPSVALTGIPTAPDATRNNASQQIANMQSVQNSMLGGFVNKFRNGGFDINTRPLVTLIAGAAQVYTLDGWRASCTGVNTTIQRGANIVVVPGLGQLNAAAVAAATGLTGFSFSQRIEGIVADDLDNNQVTVQFLLTNTTPNVLTPTLSVDYPTTTVNDFSALTNVLNSVALQTVPASGSAQIAYTFTAPIGLYKGAQITLNFGNSLNAASGSLYIQAADIRPTPGVASGLNSNPPLAELRPKYAEQPANKRYLPFWGPQTSGGAVGVAVGQCITTTQALVMLPSDQDLLKDTTGITVSNVADFRILSANGTQLTPTGITFSAPSPRGVEVQVTVASGLVAGNAAEFRSVSSSALILGTGAEL